MTYVAGSLTVNQKEVTITAKDKTKEYDGTALVGNEVVNGVSVGTSTDYEVSGLADGDSIDSLDFTGSQTEYGTTDTVPLNAQIVNGTGSNKTDVTDSYKITYVSGLLKVTKKALTITAGSAENKYDGTALTCKSFTSDGLVNSGDIKDTISKVTYSGSQTVVGESANKVSDAVILNKDGKDVSESYNVTYADGKLKVTKRSIKFIAGSASKQYDGTALTSNKYTVQEDGLAEGDSVNSITITGSQTNNGESDNVINKDSIVITNNSGTNVTASYSITVENGKLSVNDKMPITITAGSAEKTYDGTALTCDDYEISAGSLAAGDSIYSVSFTSDSTITYAGSKENVIYSDSNGVGVVIKNKDGKTVTGDYNITLEPGELKVKKKDITVTAGSSEVTYDGTALTNATFKVKDSSGNEDESFLTNDSAGVSSVALASGTGFTDKISLTFTGSQTVAGSSENKASDAVITRPSTS